MTGRPQVHYISQTNRDTFEDSYIWTFFRRMAEKGSFERRLVLDLVFWLCWGTTLSRAFGLLAWTENVTLSNSNYTPRKKQFLQCENQNRRRKENWKMIEKIGGWRSRRQYGFLGNWSKDKIPVSREILGAHIWSELCFLFIQMGN